MSSPSPSPSKTTVRPPINPKETVALSAKKEQGTGGKTARREGAKEPLPGPELLAPKAAAFRRPSGVVEPYRRESGETYICVVPSTAPLRLPTGHSSGGSVALATDLVHLQQEALICAGKC